MNWTLTSQHEYVHKALEITIEYTFAFLYAIVTESFLPKIYLIIFFKLLFES